MNCLLEAIGLALPGNGTIPAVDPTAQGAGARRRRGRSWSCSRGHQAARHRHRRSPSTTPSPWTWPWAAPPTPCCTRWPSPHEAGVDLPAGAAQRDVRAHAVHLQGLALAARKCTWRTWTAPAASAPSSRRLVTQARGAAPGRADRHRRHAGRDHRRRADPGCRRHPPAGDAVHRGRRPGGAVRQPGARRARWSRAPAWTPSCFVFEGAAMVFESQDECLAALARREVTARPGGGHPLRGPQGRPGHAGDALAHLHDQGPGAGQAAWR